MSCEDCYPLTEAGPQGSQGLPGIDGIDGTDGSDSYTITTANYNQPAVSGYVTVSVEDSSWMAIDQIIFIENGGYYTVVLTPTNTSAIIENGGFAGNLAPGTLVAIGSKVVPGGPISPSITVDANSFLGNNTASPSTPIDINVGTNQIVGRKSSGNLATQTCTDLAYTLLDDLTQAQMQATIGALSEARAVNTTGSLTGGGDLSADRTLSLVNDDATPGNTYYYGTDGSGTKGFFPLVGGGYNTVDVFTSSGTWTKPATLADDAYVMVICTGGGGGGAGDQANNQIAQPGNSGATAIAIFQASTLGATEAVTVGAGGAGGAGITPAAGSAGGTSSFGALCSAGGGSGGRRGNVNIPSAAATATGGDINLDGSRVDVHWGGFLGCTQGGASYWGPGAQGNDTDSTIYGSGGPGAYNTSAGGSPGGDGADGIVVVFYNA